MTDDLIDNALRRQRVLHERRITALYNRHRALFAESLVAELLEGAEEVVDPSAAWDVAWSPQGEVIRIQVKCSGGHLPRNPDKSRVTPAAWSIRVPKHGWDPDGSQDVLWNLGAGHHCDVFVLARHVGDELGAGWSFAAVPLLRIANAQLRSGKPRTRFTPKHLDQWGIELVPPNELQPAVRGAASSLR